MHLRLLLRYVKLLCHWKLFFLFNGEVVPGSSLQKVFTQFMIQRKIRVGGTSFYVDYLKHTGINSPKILVSKYSEIFLPLLCAGFYTPNFVVCFYPEV